MFSSAESSFMSLAMDQAKAAYQNNEVPVGAIIVKDNKVIGKGRNRVIENQNVSSHAEIEAITDASKKIKNYRLNKSTMYVTLEPCHMCLKAMIDARIEEVIFATLEPKTGSIISIDNFLENKALNHKIKYKYGLYEEESSKLLKSFFIQKR